MEIENKIWYATFECYFCGFEHRKPQDNLNKVKYPRKCDPRETGAGCRRVHDDWVLIRWEIDEDAFTPEDWDPIDAMLKRAGIQNGIRQFILARDEFKCQICNEPMRRNVETKSNLHVHHIKPLSQDGSNAPSNLITLCQNCHKWVHQLKRRADDNPDHVEI